MCCEVATAHVAHLFDPATVDFHHTGVALATLGYFDYPHRLPRATVAMTGGFLPVALPTWFVWIRQRPNGEVNGRC